jgi:nicotinamide-nucleotide amidase
MTPNNLKQAYRFERGEVLPNANGTAPGLWVEQDGKVLCMLPGPPNELQPMFTEQVLPRLARLGLLLDREAYVQLRTAGVGESMLETKLQPIFDRHPALGVAFCAHSGPGRLPRELAGRRLGREKLGGDRGGMRHAAGRGFVCFGHDSLAKVCADQLRSRPHARRGGVLHGRPAREQLHRHLRRLQVFPGRHACATATRPRCSCWTAPSACSRSTAR